MSNKSGKYNNSTLSYRIWTWLCLILEISLNWSLYLNATLSFSSNSLRFEFWITWNVICLRIELSDHACSSQIMQRSSKQRLSGKQICAQGIQKQRQPFILSYKHGGVPDHIFYSKKHNQREKKIFPILSIHSKGSKATRIKSCKSESTAGCQAKITHQIHLYLWKAIFRLYG